MQGTWTKEDFAAWRRRCGLSLSDAAAVLHASRSSIASWQNGARSITARTQALAEAYEASRFQGVSDWVDGGEYADACDALPVGAVGLMTAADVHGVSNHLLGCIWYITPARSKPITVEGIRAIPVSDTHTDIEHRIAADGRMYRSTSLPRTVYELITHERLVGRTAVSEVMDLATSEQDLTIEQVLNVADRLGATDAQKQAVRDTFARVGAPY